jgi:hypothetical protein
MQVRLQNDGEDGRKREDGNLLQLGNPTLSAGSQPGRNHEKTDTDSGTRPGAAPAWEFYVLRDGDRRSHGGENGKEHRLDLRSWQGFRTELWNQVRAQRSSGP